MEVAEQNGVINQENGVINLLEIVRKHPGQRANTLAKEAGKSARTIQRWLDKLKAEGKIRYEGSNKTGGYVVVE